MEAAGYHEGIVKTGSDHEGRHGLAFTRFGTILAMTHIQLPFTLLPIYSVMKGVDVYLYYRAPGEENFTQVLMKRRGPEKIARIYIEPGVGIVPFEARQLGFAIGLDGPQVSKFVKLATSLYEAFVATDASLVEINPLLVTEQGDLLALDAKMNFDDNALFRHPELEAWRDLYPRLREQQPRVHGPNAVDSEEPLSRTRGSARVRAAASARAHCRNHRRAAPPRHRDRGPPAP